MEAGPRSSTRHGRTTVLPVHRYLDSRSHKENVIIKHLYTNQQGEELGVSWDWGAPTETNGRRGLTQHGVLPFLAGRERGGTKIRTVIRESYRLRWCTVPPALPRGCELLANPAAAAAEILLNVHKTPPWAKPHMGAGTPCTECHDMSFSTFRLFTA